MQTTQLSTYLDLLQLGYSPIPVIWDAETKQASVHPKHETEIPHGKLTEDILRSWLNNGFAKANAMALKMYPPYGSIDFDLKNTDNKTVYDEWLRIVQSQNEDVLSKICIERTRNNGYHAYIKYSKLSHKIPVARNEKGEEVISVYTGGLLSYCSPTPGYEIVHNDFADVDELTDEEFDLLISTAALFNEMKEWKPGERTVALIEYPTEYENTCLQFDEKCTDEIFEALLNSINLYRVSDETIRKHFSRAKFVPFLREGSKAQYSAKVYFGRERKRCLLFSASMTGFPTWHDSVKCGDESWSLSPSKIVYYKNSKSWDNTIDEINCICESACIEISQPIPMREQPLFNERLQFPYDIFPDEIQNYIKYLSINPEYFAAFCIGSLSSIIGKTAHLIALKGYKVHCNVYMAIVGSPGSDKSPAIKKAFAPVKEYDRKLYISYAQAKEQYQQELARWEKDKKSGDKPKEPVLSQVIIEDATIEMTIKILSQNRYGNVLYADELSGYMQRMNQYKSGDEGTKWLTLWDGGDVMVQRMTRDENKAIEPFISVVGGIQQGLLESLSSKENEHNGFYHRFLFCYPESREKRGFLEFTPVPDIVEQDFNILFEILANYRNESESERYTLSHDALMAYNEWYEHKNGKYNRATQDHVKGIISKYQNYCLRFALLLQVVHDRGYRTGEISLYSMQCAIRLTEYFLGNMIKALRYLKPEAPTDKLPETYNKIYAELGEIFTIKSASEVAARYNVKPAAVKMFIQRGNNTLFNKIRHGEYEKIY